MRDTIGRVLREILDALKVRDELTSLLAGTPAQSSTQPNAPSNPWTPSQKEKGPPAPPDRWKTTENLLGAGSAFVPVLGQIASTMQNVRTILEAFEHFQTAWKTFMPTAPAPPPAPPTKKPAPPKTPRPRSTPPAPSAWDTWPILPVPRAGGRPASPTKSTPPAPPAPIAPPAPPAPIAPPPAPPPYWKPEHLSLSPDQASRKAKDAAIAAGKNAQEVMGIGQEAFEFAHKHTTNRGAVYQRELLRAKEGGKDDEEASRLAKEAVNALASPPSTRKMPPKVEPLSTPPRTTRLPETANQEQEGSYGGIGKLEEKIEDLTDVMGDLVKEMGKKHQTGEVPTGGDNKGSPIEGLGGAIDSIAHATRPGQSIGEKISSTVHIIEAMQAAARLAAAL